MTPLEVRPVAGLPEVRPGDDLAELILAETELRDGDVLVVAQKVVSKAEDALVRVPEGQDRAAARQALVESEAVRVLVRAPWTTIVETRHGLVCANAGIDASNVEAGLLALLPEDPDHSARRLRDALQQRTSHRLAVLVSDTFGRPWRQGQTEVAIGAAGIGVLRDERGGRDRFGEQLEVTLVALADELAAAADLVRRKADGVPVVVIRGLDWTPDERAGAADLVRPAETDLFPRGRGALADLLAEPAVEPASPGLSDREAARLRAAAGTAAMTVDLAAGVLRLRDDDAFALGVAAASVRAAALDLGLTAVLRRDGATAAEVLVGR